MSNRKLPEETPVTVPITVDGYSPRYQAAVADLLGIEGGFVDDPVDRGGTTKYGISLRFLASEGAFDEDGDGKADFDLDMDGDIDGKDIRQLTRGDAVFLYHRCFWQSLGCERLPRPLGEVMFDQGVNGGRTTARKLLQRALNTCLLDLPAVRAGWQRPLLKVDGQIGDATLGVLRHVLGFPKHGMAAVVQAYRDATAERYRQIAARYPSQKRFLKGWLNRARRLGAA